MDPTRRILLCAGAALPALGLNTAASAAPSIAATVPTSDLPPAQRARDETYWQAVTAQYDVNRDVANLENGYWGVMARPVLAAYRRRVAEVNHDNAVYARVHFADDYARVKARAAGLLGIDASELAMARNATEALQALIGGYNRLQPGDAVLYADLDYDSMITAMKWLRQRRGVEVVNIGLPEPANYQNLIDAYEQALRAHPRVRMMLLTYASHRTGLLTPVAEIVAMARRHGVDVIVDATQALGQVDFRLPDLGADFVGFNFHKWIGAPLGTGGLYVRRERIADIDPFMGQEGPADSIDTRTHTGTVDFAALLTLPDAIDFHLGIGAATKHYRLQYLRDRWVHAVADLPSLQILTPEDPRLYSASTSVRLRGQTSMAQNAALARRLLDEFGVLTVPRDGVAGGACVRVTPSLFTRPEEVDRLAAALRSIARAA